MCALFNFIAIWQTLPYTPSSLPSSRTASKEEFMGNKEKTKVTPAYLPLRTFLNSFENLAQGIPPRIDRSIWKNQPGGVQSQIVGAYRFFGLIDEQDHPTKKLQDLVQNRQKPAEQIKQLVEERYASILENDLGTMTSTLLDEYFDAAFDSQGETKRKAITFFLSALKLSGFTLSSFLQDKMKAGSGPRKKRMTNKRSENPDDGEEDENLADDGQTTGSTKTIELMSGGAITLSVSVDVISMSGSDRTFVFELIDKLQEYETRQKTADTLGKTMAAGNK
jgi:hypothetical protein